MRVLIVDDENLARDRLRRMIGRIEGYEVVGEAANGLAAIKNCSALKPDIVLLDIRMPGMDGMMAAKEIIEQAEAPALIFCTAYDEYALDAFEVTATDYLLKPVSANKLQAALTKAQRLTKAQMEALDQQDCSKQMATRCHLSANSRGKMQLIPIEDVRVLFADQKYVTAYHLNGEALLEESLKSLEDEFSQRFIRVHRNALVAYAFIEALEKDAMGSFCVRLTGCNFLPQVSRRQVSELRNLLHSL